MKILIPFSGGINSTYTMWRWLTETDCEIVARYAVEEFESDNKVALVLFLIYKVLYYKYFYNFCVIYLF